MVAMEEVKEVADMAEAETVEGPAGEMEGAERVADLVEAAPAVVAMAVVAMAVVVSSRPRVARAATGEVATEVVERVVV